MPTIGEILRENKQKGLIEPLSAELWLGYLLGLSKEAIFTRSEEDLPDIQTEKFWQGVEEIRQGKPVEQLIGYKEFYGMSFMVNDNVLIPRPESEMLVDLAKDFIQENLTGQEVRVVDVGTGSGCILLALLKTCLDAQGVGIEISPEALVVARGNAQALGVEERVELLQGNLLEPVERECQIILANLPYIGREKFNFVADNVAKYEPEVALFGGPDGLDLYRQMFEQLNQKKWRPRLMAGEFGFGQEEAMRDVLTKYFSDQNFQIIPDLAGIPRVFVINFA
jgi:release factor glutamine methyltransferase